MWIHCCHIFKMKSDQLKKICQMLKTEKNSSNVLYLCFIFLFYKSVKSRKQPFKCTIFIKKIMKLTKICF